MSFGSARSVKLSYKKLKHHAFTVTGGTVQKAQRMAKPSNIRWRITVLPDSDLAVQVLLPRDDAVRVAGRHLRQWEEVLQPAGADRRRSGGIGNGTRRGNPTVMAYRHGNTGRILNPNDGMTQKPTEDTDQSVLRAPGKPGAHNIRMTGLDQQPHFHPSPKGKAPSEVVSKMNKNQICTKNPD